MFFIMFPYFSFSYLAKGMVEKLEVVNKKWVRVRLTPGSSSDPSVFYLKIYISNLF